MVDRADMHAVRTDDGHMFLDVAVVVHRGSPIRFGNRTTHATIGCTGAMG
jgi:hypothetical protein